MPNISSLIHGFVIVNPESRRVIGVIDPLALFAFSSREMAQETLRKCQA